MGQWTSAAGFPNIPARKNKNAILSGAYMHAAMSAAQSAEPVVLPSSDHVDLTEVDRVIDVARREVIRQQHGDGHFVFELEADATIPSEYILLEHFLDEVDD